MDPKGLEIQLSQYWGSLKWKRLNGIQPFSWQPWTSPVVLLKLKTSPLWKSRIQWIIASRTQGSLQHVRPCSPLRLLPQVWGRIHRLWSRNREETRYLATTAVVSCSRCNSSKDGSPMWTKWVLCYLKACYSCMEGKLRLGLCTPGQLPNWVKAGHYGPQRFSLLPLWLINHAQLSLTFTGCGQYVRIHSAKTGCRLYILM